MKKIHHVKSIAFNDNIMHLTVDGKVYDIQLEDISKRLCNASDLERETFEISPSGYGIHWPLIDEDLSIDGLIGVEHFSQSRKATAVI